MSVPETRNSVDHVDPVDPVETATSAQPLQGENDFESAELIQAAKAAQREILAGRLDLATLACFEPEEIEALYSRALQQLDAGLPDHATGQFLGLISLKPKDVRFLRGLGLCYHHQRLWGWASTAYLMALSHDPDDGIAMALNAECTLHLDGKQAAHRLLKEVIARGVRRPAEAPYIQRATEIMAKIKL